MEVKTCCSEDIHDIYNYCEPYYAEVSAGCSMVPCKETAYNTFASTLHYDDYVVFAAMDGDKVCGVAIIVRGRSFFEGYEGDIDFFYIREEDRGSGSSRALVEACAEYADEHLTILYGGCATFLGKQNNTLYVNLYKKFGFKELGSIVCYTGEK